MMRSTPSSHGAGTNPHLGWGDTIPGMGWVGVPHPSSWLSTLSRGYLPYLGVPTLARGYLPWTGGYLIQCGYQQLGNLPPTQGTYPSLPIYLDQGGTYLGQGGYVIE